jgi:DNA-binding HxlR family transcriptional regulator
MKEIPSEHTQLSCPIQKLLEVLSDGWTILIIRDLLLSPMRFCELEKSLTGISTRTLTLKLQKLAEEDVVENNDHHYTITEKGKRLKSIIREMEKVGVTL